MVLDAAEMVRRQVLAGDRAWHTPPLTATNGRALYCTNMHYIALYCTYMHYIALYCTYMHYIVLELQLSKRVQSTLQWLVGRDSGEELGRAAKDANGDTGSQLVGVLSSSPRTKHFSLCIGQCPLSIGQF